MYFECDWYGCHWTFSSKWKQTFSVFFFFCIKFDDYSCVLLLFVFFFFCFFRVFVPCIFSNLISTKERKKTANSLFSYDTRRTAMFFYFRNYFAVEGKMTTADNNKWVYSRRNTNHKDSEHLLNEYVLFLALFQRLIMLNSVVILCVIFYHHSFEVLHEVWKNWEMIFDNRIFFPSCSNRCSTRKIF
jgi:hypothetical protein